MGECLSRQEAFEKMNQNESKCQEHNRVDKVVAVQEKIATSLEKIIRNQELALKNAKMDANLFEHMFESLLGDADSDSEEEESSTSDKRSKKSRLFHAILGIEKNMEGIETKNGGIPSTPRGSARDPKDSQEIPMESQGIPWDSKGSQGEPRGGQEITGDPMESQGIPRSRNPYILKILEILIH